MSYCFADKSYDDYFENITFEHTSMLHVLQKRAHIAALELKRVLCKHKLNVVTQESLTSGLIASTLTDVPGMGQFIYGGMVVYDTDAKRYWLNVTTPGVYSRQTARQMAEGGLKNSRAMVAIAVTGNAMVTPEHLNDEGVVDIGVSFRTSSKFKTVTKRYKFCDDRDFKDLCAEWKSYVRKVNGKWQYPPIHKTQVIAKAIRLATVEKALMMAVDHIQKFQNELGEDVLRKTAYDGLYLGCDEPSDVIFKHLSVSDQSTLNRQWGGDCPEGSME